MNDAIDVQADYVITVLQSLLDQPLTKCKYCCRHPNKDSGSEESMQKFKKIVADYVIAGLQSLIEYILIDIFNISALV